MYKIEDYVSSIKENGYSIIKSYVPIRECENILNFAKNFNYDEMQNDILSSNTQRLNAFAKNIYNIAVKRPEYLNLFISGTSGEILKNLLNDQFYKSIPEMLPNYILRSMLLRSSIDEMPYHIDSFIPYNEGPVSVVQASIFLEKSRVDNGCTLVVPGSHLSGRYAPQGINPQAIALEADVGDLVIWDSRIWHGTTKNVSGLSRWALISTFTRWYIKQGYDYPNLFGHEQFDNMSIEEKIVFGYCSSVPRDEFDKTEVKGGIETLARWERRAAL
jgi:hypothetical protein